MVPKVDKEIYLQLYKKVSSALDLQKETRNIDFKRSTDWEALKEKIVKCALSMSNLRDGGVVIVGVAEKSNGYSIDGVDDLIADTYDVDDCIEMINKYCSPKINPDIIRISVSGKYFLVFQFHGFTEVPIVCCKNHDEWKLRKGDFWTRPAGMAKCERISNEVEMHEVIRQAAIYSARRMINEAKEIGMQDSLDSKNESLFSQELGGL